MIKPKNSDYPAFSKHLYRNSLLSHSPDKNYTLYTNIFLFFSAQLLLHGGGNSLLLNAIIYKHRIACVLCQDNLNCSTFFFLHCMAMFENLLWFIHLLHMGRSDDLITSFPLDEIAYLRMCKFPLVVVDVCGFSCGIFVTIESIYDNSSH